jgi:hypothetical protein
LVWLVPSCWPGWIQLQVRQTPACRTGFGLACTTWKISDLL